REHAEARVRAVLGVLADRAGVDDHEVSGRVVLDGAVAHLLQARCELEGVCLVHLAAESPDVEGSHRRVLDGRDWWVAARGGSGGGGGIRTLGPGKPETSA